ncbi:MAG: restriction endonuclease subunit S [Eggerthella sp.]|nr:restriction endonuclease subunit S [Eggerthella sp.]
MNKLKNYKLSTLYSMSSGVSTSPDQAGHGYPFLSFSTIFNNPIIPDELDERMDTTFEDRKKCSVKRGDVFLTRTSETLDELAMSSVALRDYPNSTFSGFAKRLRPNSDTFPDPAFMAAYLRGPYFRKVIQSMTTMTTRASFNKDLFGLLELQLVDYQSQVGIGKLFSNIERQINLNRKVNDNLQSTLQALYGYWFMQFNFPDVNGRPYRSSGGRMSYNEKLGRSIPEGWHVASIVNNPLTDVITPGVDLFKTKTYYATADVNGIDIGMGSSVDYETRESRANMQPGLHTVWFAKMKNSVKHLFLGHSMKRVIDDSILSTGFMGLQCKKVAFEYISAFIDGPYFERAKDQYANGATQQAVGNAELESVYLVIPDDETLARFHNLTRGLVESIGETIIENKKLVELRDWLLPMLMNGQASVEAMQPNYRLSDC